MQIDNIRVSRKLWGAFVGLMIAMLLMSAWAQNRSNSAMARALEYSGAADLLKAYRYV